MIVHVRVYYIYRICPWGGGVGQGNTNRGWQIVDPNISFLSFVILTIFHNSILFTPGGGWGVVGIGEWNCEHLPTYMF